MSSSLAQPPDRSDASAAARAGLSWSEWCIVTIIIVAGLPLSLLQCLRLWELPHYQFFPVLLLGCGYLVYLRWPRGSVQRTRRGLIGAYALILLGLVLQMLAVLLVSPWLGMFAMVLATGGVLWYATGHAFRDVLPAWGLALLVVQLPFNLDRQLITWLQLGTASLSSDVLNLLGVLHLHKGVVIELPAREMFVEEACSGIQSLFALLALAGLLAVFNRRSLMCSLALFGSAILVALVVNLIRVVTIVAALAKYDVDLTKDPEHTILGVAVFAFALVALASLDRFWVFWFMSIPPDGKSRFTLVWNKWVGAAEEVSAADSEQNGPAILPSYPVRRRWALLSLTGVALVVLTGEIVAYPVMKPEVLQGLIQGSGEDLELVRTLDVLDEASLPAELGNWRRMHFEKVQRQTASFFGEYSKTWGYTAPNARAMVAVDYPFRGWHDLLVCYRDTGWQLDEPELVEGDGGRITVQAAMVRESGEHGFLVFDLTNSRFVPESPRYQYELPRMKQEMTLAGERLRAIFDKSFKKLDQTFTPADALITFQNQTLFVTRVPATAEEQLEVIAAHRRLRDRILNIVQDGRQ